MKKPKQPMYEPITIKDTFGEKKIGDYCKKENTFVKNVKENWVWRKGGDAIGFDYEVFSKLLLPKNANIVIIRKERDPVMILKTTAEEVRQKGFFLEYSKYRKQIFLRVTDFN